MPRPARPRLLLAGVLGLTALALLAVRFWPGRPPKPPGPLTFTDVTDQAGLRFRHTSGATPQKLLPETMGSGVAVLDFDRDGRPDLFFVNGRPWPGRPGRATQALYRNRGDGTFEDVSAACGLDVELYGMGAAVGDYDGDGWPDLFVTAVGGDRLFRNVEGKRFEDVTLRVGLGKPAWPGGSFDEFLGRAEPLSFPASAAFLDYDGDGRLDLFVCNYLTWSPALDQRVEAGLPGGKRAYVPPQQFNGAYCVLYRNVNGDHFEDVSAAAGVRVSEAGGPDRSPRPVGKALGVVVCDPDGDGWPDVVVANDTVRNFFFHNVPADGGAGRKFEESGLFAGLAYADGRPRGGMGIDAAEVMPDSLAVVVANFSNEPSSLFRRGSADPVRFFDVAPEVGLAARSRSPMKFGALFFDADRDGRPDLFTANGHLEPDIAAARPGESYPQPAQLFRNTGDWADLFVPAGDPFPAVVGRGCAYLDYDGDGDPDLVVTENNGPARLYRNDTPTNNHSLRLVLTGAGPNRSAVGAAVEVEAGGTTRRWYVTGSHGYLSQSELTVTVGLGSLGRADRVMVRWPGREGRRQEWGGLEAGRAYELTEGAPEPRAVGP